MTKKGRSGGGPTIYIYIYDCCSINPLPRIGNDRKLPLGLPRSFRRASAAWVFSAWGHLGALLLGHLGAILRDWPCWGYLGPNWVPGAKCASTQCPLLGVRCPGAHKTYAQLGRALAKCTCCQASAGPSANLPRSFRAQAFCSFELTCISSPCEPIEEDLRNNAHV